MHEAMIRFVIRLLLLSGLFSSSISCAPPQSADQPQQGDTVVHVFGRRILVPIGVDEPYMNMGINELRNDAILRPYRIHAPGDRRQVTFRKARVLGAVGGQETVDAFCTRMCKDYGDKEYVFLGCGRTEQGCYDIYELRPGPEHSEAVRYLLYWYAPNEDYALEVSYSIGTSTYVKLGGIAELKRFAERVQLLPE